MPPETPSELTTESGLRRHDDLISDNEIKPLDTITDVLEKEEEVKAPEEPELTPEEEVSITMSAVVKIDCWVQAAIRKQITIELRKAELRQRMEEASKARRAKKGFMTPERKKKLRLLLRRKAAEELKKEQEQKALQRQWVIEDRCGDPEDLDWASKDDLIDICEDYYQRIWECEAEKWDLEYEIRKRAYEIAELSSKVNDLRGKFQRPILKKVSKYENKFSLLQRKAAEFNYRNQLKMVKRPEFSLKDLEDKKNHGDKRGDKGEEGDASRDQETPIPEEAPEDGAEEKEDVEEQLRYTGENEEETVPEELEGDVNVDDPTVLEGEPRLDDEEEVGLEGEGTLKPEASEGEQGVEGEPLGGQSLEQEEVQPTEPQPPPLPVHTEEDLWFYLKETVSSVHPATVEEFVQNLIGTLQHVPEEYLKPVIDANIKRATSPCVADDEHPDIQEGVSLAEGEDALPDGSVPIESLEGGTTVSGEVPEVTSEIAGDSATPEVPSEVPNDPASPEETADGFSSVEAAA